MSGDACEEEERAVRVGGRVERGVGGVQVAVESAQVRHEQKEVVLLVRRDARVDLRMGERDRQGRRRRVGGGRGGQLVVRS